MFRKLILLTVSTVAIFSTAVFAVGLGGSELMSGLNQPLKAEIKLLSVEDLAEHELHVSLADAQEFDKVGVERLFLLNSIRFETVRDDKGNLIVKLSSHETIKEPFLNFVVALKYPKGRFVKEYTFLLDPPVFEELTSSTIEKTQTLSSSRVEPTAPKKTSVAPPERIQPSFTGSTFGPVSSTDTLWGIANKTRPGSQVSIHQTLVAIYRANPHAFAQGNINNLLRGEVLQIPDAETISQVPHRAALQDVVMQNRQWRSGGARRIVDNGKKAVSTESFPSEARLSLATQESEATVSSRSSGGDLALSDTRDLSEAREALVQSQEKSATLQAENDELRTRLADLLQKLESSKSDSALNIADAELTALTQPQKDQAETESPVTDSSKSASQTSTLPPPKLVTPKLVTPKQEKGLIDEILDSGLLLGSALAGIVVIVFVVFWRMRKRMEEEDFQDDLVASAGAGSIDTTETFELPDVGDDMLVELDMDATGEALGESEDEIFDPLGEADIYIAYGKFEQAESLLLESIEENPIRSDLKVKLMECYAETENKDKFDALAEDVSQAVDAEEWQQQINTMREQAWSVEAREHEDFDLPSTEDIFGDEDADIGAEFDSINLEDSDEGSSADDDEFSLDTEEDSAEEDFSIGGDDDSSDEEEFSLDDEGEEEFSLDDEDEEELSLDDEDEEELSLDDEDEEEFSLDDEEEFDLDMDMDMDLDDDITEEASVAPSEAITETFDSIDNDDFSLDEETNVSEDDEPLELDNDSSFEEADANEIEDEISTKLDLARAYIDMGDSDGAKEILTEVLADGNEEQKEEAQALIEKAE